MITDDQMAEKVRALAKDAVEAAGDTPWGMEYGWTDSGMQYFAATEDGNEVAPVEEVALLFAASPDIADWALRLYAENQRLRERVQRVEALRARYRQRRDDLAGTMHLSYCDPYEVVSTAVRDLDTALAERQGAS